MTFFCYIVECADGSFYTGCTTDPPRRERQHNLGKGARYTRQHRPVRLVYIEPQPDRASAMRRERSMKNLTHIQKKKLIQKYSSGQCEPILK
ncbi:MAG: GIY-YIG nuclease family protein [Planctomycetes bacterium]|nr:GIY-YIG nuclease family protein [Planctomycetota bacterium]